MLPGYSHNAVISVLGSMVAVALHRRSQEPSSDPPGGEGAVETLETSLRAVFSQWEKEVLPTANATFQTEYRTLASLVLEMVQHQAKFGPTPDRSN